MSSLYFCDNSCVTFRNATQGRCKPPPCIRDSWRPVSSPGGDLGWRTGRQKPFRYWICLWFFMNVCTEFIWILNILNGSKRYLNYNYIYIQKLNDSDMNLILGVYLNGFVYPHSILIILIINCYINIVYHTDIKWE